MLLLKWLLTSTLLFLLPISAVPFDVNGINDPDISALPALEVSKRTLDASVAIRGVTGPQRRRSDSNLALISLNQALPSSNSVGKPKPVKDHEVNCFPRGSDLADAVAKDCHIIINNIILGMDDPFRTRTWGFNDDVEINLSLPEYQWTFQGCYIRVNNIDETKVDEFRPIEVAEMAQNIIRKCVVEAKEPLGGNADIGHLRFPFSFYVAVAGTWTKNGHGLGKSTVLSLPSDRPHTIESRASVNLLLEHDLSSAVTERLEAGETYPVRCFDPSFVHRLKPTVAADCAIIINDIIPRLPDPMLERSFGYTDAEDVNLSKNENDRWVFGQCVVLIRNIDKTSRDVFRYVDIANTAQRIVGKCVEGSKYVLGGTADIGTIEDNFFVVLGGVTGVRQVESGNGTILVLNPTQ